MKYKTSIIIKEAYQIKIFIEKYERIPKTCTIGNTTLSPYSAAYLLSKVVQEKFQSNEVNLANVIVYDGDVKFSDTINEKIMKDDYLKMINNFIKFCITNKRVPRYITTQKSKTKVSFELFLYCLSKIVNFYKENKTLPNYCTFNKTILANTKTSSNNSKKSNSKSTSSSKKTNTCSNPYTSSPNLPESERGQNTSYGCANNGQQEAFYKLTGKIFKESELAKLSGTTTKGTSHSGINTCIAAIAKKLGIKLTVKWVNFSSLGKTTDERFEALGKIICKSNKAVITHIAYMSGGEDLFDKDGVWFGHYEPIKSINTKTKTVKVLNSLGYKKATGGYKGHIQDRSFKVEASYLANTSGGQPSICIITKG